MKDALQPYFKKRDFALTTEPQGGNGLARARSRSSSRSTRPPACTTTSASSSTAC